MKILFIDLESVNGKSGITEIFKSWRGFVPIGLAAPANPLNISGAIAEAQAAADAAKSAADESAANLVLAQLAALFPVE